MPTAIITPIIGLIRGGRDSMANCYPIHEKRAEQGFATADQRAQAIDLAVKRVLLTDDARRDMVNRGEITVLLTIKL